MSDPVSMLPNTKSNDPGRSEMSRGATFFTGGTSASPIRFEIDISNRASVSNVGSQSGLSSIVTGESWHSHAEHNTQANTRSAVGSTPPKNHSTNPLPTFSVPAPAILGSNRRLSTTSTEHGSSMDGTDTTSHASGTAMYQAHTNGPKPPGKLTTQYVMPDGSLITGKGLGRGRPGVKRGPRKSRPPGEEVSETASGDLSQTPVPSTTPAGSKRKRSDSNASILLRSISSPLTSRESSVEYNPTATQTRSGRQTQKPTPILVPEATPSATASPATKKVATSATATPNLKTHPKIKRKVYRGKEQFALCEHCLRGFGPPGNVIVFCDACNHCWHQRCHQPQISKEVVTDSKAEWFCTTCDKILHGNKKAKKTPVKVELPPPPPPPQKFGPPMIGAIGLTLEQRRKYLETLNRDQLISLLLRAGEMAPHMPIFETPIPVPRVGPVLQPQFTSDYVTPVSETIALASASNEVPDEGYDDSYDEYAILYPKIGEGVKLPPERDDLNMLLEGPDSRTFSHWVKGQPVKTVVDTVPLHHSQFEKPRT